MKAIKNFRKLVNELESWATIWYEDEMYYAGQNMTSAEACAFYRKHAFVLILEKVLYCTISFAKHRITVVKMPFHFDASRVNKEMEELSNRINSYPDKERELTMLIFERYLERLQKLESF